MNDLIKEWYYLEGLTKDQIEIRLSKEFNVTITSNDLHRVLYS